MTKLNLIAEPGSHAIISTRSFNAPRELVFRAFTEAELISQWSAPKGYTIIVDKLELKKGGLWRFIHCGTDGSEYVFNGVYHVVDAPARLVYTFEWEGMPGHVLLEAITFTEENGKTTVTDTSVFETVADRDGMIQEGMEEGTISSYERLDELLAKL